jgi:hypothetical protein
MQQGSCSKRDLSRRAAASKMRAKCARPALPATRRLELMCPFRSLCKRVRGACIKGSHVEGRSFPAMERRQETGESSYDDVAASTPLTSAVVTGTAQSSSPFCLGDAYCHFHHKRGAKVDSEVRRRIVRFRSNVRIRIGSDPRRRADGIDLELTAPLFLTFFASP